MYVHSTFLEIFTQFEAKFNKFSNVIMWIAFTYHKETYSNMLMILSTPPFFFCYIMKGIFLLKLIPSNENLLKESKVLYMTLTGVVTF